MIADSRRDLACGLPAALPPARAFDARPRVGALRTDPIRGQLKAGSSIL